MLTNMFKLCEPLTEVQQLTGYLKDFLGTIAMVNYPYSASFLGNFPPWPVSVSNSSETLTRTSILDTHTHIHMAFRLSENGKPSIVD